MTEDFSNVQSGVSSTSKTKYYVTAPDGHELELEGPVGASPEDIAYVASTMYTPAQPQPPDARSGAQVAVDQAGNVIKGAAGAITGIPGFVGEAAGALKDIAMRPADPTAYGRAGNLVSGLAHSFVDPIYQAGQGAGALMGGNEAAAATEPGSPEWKAAAQVAGGQLGGAVVGEGLARGARGVGAVLDTPAQDFYNRAAALRAEPQPAAGVPLSKHGALIEAAKAALQKGKQAAAYGMEKLGDFNYERQRPVAEPLPSIPEPAPTVQAPVSQPAEVHNPAMFQDRAPLVSYPEEAMPSVAPEPTPMVPKDLDVAEMQQQIQPAGRAAQKWVNNNASEAYNLIPEIRGVPMGEGFRVRATNAFKNLEADMKAAQASVPERTPIAVGPIKQALLEVKADAALANRPAVMKVLKQFEDVKSPTITWKDLLEFKDGIRKSGSFGTDPFVRKAYGKFMDATSKVSPEVAKANKNFSIGMRLLEHSGIDTSSLQFLNPKRALLQ